MDSTGCPCCHDVSDVLRGVEGPCLLLGCIAGDGKGILIEDTDTVVAKVIKGVLIEDSGFTELCRFCDVDEPLMVGMGLQCALPCSLDAFSGDYFDVAVFVLGELHGLSFSL